MKKHLVRFLSLCLSLAILLTFAACGGEAPASEVQDVLDFEEEQGEGLTQDESKETDGTTGNKTDATISGSGTTVTDKVEFDSKDPFANIPKRLRGSTVTFACWGDEGHDKYKKVYKAFTQKTGINVKIQNIDQKGYESTVMQRIAAGNAPDVLVDCYNFANMLEVLQPVENLVDIKDKFWDQDVIKISTVNGHTYGLSSLKSNWSGHKFIVYNKKLFEANSVMSPGDYYKRGQWTYENALKCMRDITKISGNYGGLISPFLMAASLGTPVVSYDTAKQTFVNNIKSANVLAAYQYYATIKEEHIWETGMWYNHFNNGNVGLYDSDVWSIKFNGRFAKFDDNSLVAVPMPTSYQGKPAKQVGVYRAYCIAKNAKNPEGGAYFLRWFLDYQNYKDAGVKVYKNEKLEDFYYNTYIPLIEKEGINYSFYETAMAYMGQDVNTYIQADESGKAQINGLLSSKSNEVDAAVKALNEKIKKR